MADLDPPQLGDIPSQSEFRVPTLSSTQGTNASSTEQPTANGTGDSVQNAKDTVVNTPVTQAARDQAQKTSASFNNLAAARKTPSATTVDGQQLTNYHSFFYHLLSWEEPHASAISYGAIVTAIFAARYLNILPLFFKSTCWVLGSVAIAELAGQFVLSQGLASSFRPKKYFTIPRETLESALEDVEQLINFFVIESQRILFAENVLNTITAFIASLTGYLLYKVVPFWGLTLITVSVAYLAPLIYITNREVIDEQINNLSEILNSQAKQVKDIAGTQASRATSSVKSYTSEYTAKAQEYIGSTKAKTSNSSPAYSSKQFPEAPKHEPEPATGVNTGDLNAVPAS